MKRITPFILAFAALAFALHTYAQTTTPSATTPTVKTRVKKTAGAAADTTKSKATAAAGNLKTKASTTAASASQGAAKSADKVIGTDSKGRTLYQGPKGGQYYINANGNKEYVKKTATGN